MICFEIILYVDAFLILVLSKANLEKEYNKNVDILIRLIVLSVSDENFLRLLKYGLKG